MSPKATSMSRQGHRDRVKCRGGGFDMGVVLVRRQRQGRHGPLPRSVAWSYPVTPLAAFALSGAFDKSDAINAPNLGQPAQTPSGRQIDGSGLRFAPPSLFSCELGVAGAAGDDREASGPPSEARFR